MGINGQFWWYFILAWCCCGRLVPSEARLSLLLLPRQNGIAIPSKKAVTWSVAASQLLLWSSHFRNRLPPGPSSLESPSGSRSTKTIPILTTATAALSSNCVTASFHMNVLYTVYYTLYNIQRPTHNFQQDIKSNIFYQGGFYFVPIHDWKKLWRCDIVQEEKRVKRGSMRRD